MQEKGQLPMFLIFIWENLLLVVIKQLGEKPFNHTHYVANSLSLILDKVILKIQ
jgi:hypothetical protein